MKQGRMFESRDVVFYEHVFPFGDIKEEEECEISKTSNVSLNVHQQGEYFFVDYE